jgi:uncharacterized protein YjbI with pentapeptide repeats
MTDMPWLEAFTGTELEAFESYDGIQFAGLSFDGLAAGNVKLLECRLDRTTFENSDLSRGAIADSTIADGRFVSTSAVDVRWRDLKVESTLFAGVTLAASELRRVVFTDCKLTGVNFRAAKLQDVVFERCVLTDLDLTDATAETCAFRDCHITGLDLTKTDLTAVDFRTSELGISRGHAALKGSIIDIAQLLSLAPEIAEALGIEVK